MNWVDMKWPDMKWDRSHAKRNYITHLAKI